MKTRDAHVGADGPIAIAEQAMHAAAAASAPAPGIRALVLFVFDAADITARDRLNRA
jgi:hypothetical protein